MSLRIITADQRLAEANGKTTIALFGPSGVGKTSQLRTLPAEETLCIDLEAGLKSVQGWPGDSISIRTFADAVDIACLIGGIDPAAPAEGFFSEAHHHYLSETYPDLAARIAGKRIVFVDSITDLTRQAMAWAKMRPEALSEKTGKPDTRGAFGLLAREVIHLLKHLQHAPGKTVIFVGILERVVDDFNREHWQPQMEGGKAGRELPGIVDQVISMSLFEPDPGSGSGTGADGWRHEPAKGQVRRLVCRAGNPFGLPAKDRSGRLDVTEPADLGALLAKINRI
ncbi:MAG: ATP-binding protein [Rhodospirillales bacterium]